MAGNEIHTSTLLRGLMGASDLDSFMQSHGGAMVDESFPGYLSALCESAGLVPEHVIRAAQLDRTYGHQLFNGTRRPSRDKVIQLAFGFGMTVDEAQGLLRAAGKSPLYPKIRRDAAILFCLARGMGVIETQGLLEALDLTLLGGNWRHGD